METQTTYAIGVMSGTSLDGLDIAYCKFDELQNKLSYKVINAKTIKYLDIEGKTFKCSLIKCNRLY